MDVKAIDLRRNKKGLTRRTPLNLTHVISSINSFPIRASRKDLLLKLGANRSEVKLDIEVCGTFKMKYVPGDSSVLADIRKELIDGEFSGAYTLRINKSSATMRAIKLEQPYTA